jgi:alkyl sulfatase BDS1-like metallo-beta-lactamase superfamily hydrolase
VLRAMSVEQLFDLLAVRLNGDRAEGKRLVINWVFPDRSYVLTLENCALTYLADRRRDGADATIMLDRAALNRIILRELPIPEAIQSGQIRSEGDLAKLAELFGLFDEFTLMFEIVEPRRSA